MMPFTLQRTQTLQLHTTIARSLATLNPIENVRSGGRTRGLGVDRALFRIDTEMRRTGRIFIKDIEEIFKEIKALKHASSTQSLLLLRCCGSLVPEERPEVRNKLVQEIWDTLHQLDVPLDISHYNTLLRVYLENNHKFSATEFLANLEKNGIEPNRVTYQRLIARYCQDGDIEGATKILEFMKEKQLPVGENIFSSLIMGHARANDLESSQGVLEVMRASGLEPTTDTYTALLCSYAEAGNLDAIEKILADCKEAEVPLHDRDLMEVILVLAQKGHASYVMQMIEKLDKQQGYNQDAINLIYRLMNSGCPQMAYQVFLSMRIARNALGESAPMGAFFISHLVKSGMDTSTVVHYCQEMKKEGYNPFALETALGTALSEGHPELAMALIRVLAEDNAEVRTHYFWPIITHYASQGDSQMVYKTVAEMTSMEVPMTLETFRLYVMPALLGRLQEGEDKVVTGLKGAGLSLPIVASSLVAYHLDNNDLQTAARVVSKYRTRVKNILRRTLANVYLSTGDAKAAVTILGQMVNINTDGNENKQTEEEEENQAGETKQIDIAGIVLLDLLTQLQKKTLENRVEPLLKEMCQRGISISKNSAEAALGRLRKEDSTETVLNLLNTLSSGNLVYEPLSSTPREPYSQQSVEDLEARLEDLRQSGQPTTTVEVSLLLALIRKGEVEKAEQVKKSLEVQEFPLNTGVYALLIDMYVKTENLEQARETLAAMTQRHPDAQLIPVKVIRLAQLMVQQGLVNEAEELIKTSGPESSEPSSQDLGNQQGLARQLLDIVAEKGDVASTQRLLDAIIISKFLPPSTAIFGPLIKAYMKSDNLDGALEEFEKLVHEHKFTPFKSELTQKFITLEDGPRLQKVLDLSIVVHGEMNSLYDMVISFVEADRINQAKKLINTPGLRAHNDKLDRTCQRYCSLGQVNYLENLVAVTKNVFDIDREMLFRNLLRAYIKEVDCDKALDVWTTMQEENLEPSEAFLYELGTFLEKNGRKAPFVVPAKQQQDTKAPFVVPAKQQQETKKPAVSTETSLTPDKGQFLQAIKKRDFTTAITLKKRCDDEGVHLSIQSQSELLEGLVLEQRLVEASDILRDMLVKESYPIPRVLKFLLVTLSRNGEVENIASFEKYLNESLQRRVGFLNRLADSYRAAGRWREVVESLRKRLASASDSELAAVAGDFPKGSILGLLNEVPDSVDEVTSLAEEYSARGLTEPVNCIWMHLFAEGKYAEAEEVFKKHNLEKCSNLLFGGILNTAKQQTDPQLMERLEAKMCSHPTLSPQSKGLIYSTWIDIVGEKEDYSKGLEILQKALTSIPIESLGHASLTKLKARVEASGATFPYNIPPKAVRERRQKKVESSSSSSSDSD
ncbi:hypothetical protein Pmani_004154 [Petrolisthes manimaculis]|uniref:PROP1-like PPR domain-containing protein n=1 Tax=Petrolisthes manimaculis TaxID=1843537 RepID=A0AAE1QFG8_9EUCA|nr:hypothetical protein Pmani_004154 [Petrolisthes manimaculis]